MKKNDIIGLQFLYLCILTNNFGGFIMLFKEKLYWSWNRINELTEKDLQKDDGSFLTLSVTSSCMQEIMIFLSKVTGVSEYEVRIYKAKPGFVFAPNAYDEFVRYEENEEFDTFFFPHLGFNS